MTIIVRRCTYGARESRMGHVFSTAQLEIEDKGGARYSVEYWGKDAHEIGVGDEMEGEIIRKGSKQVFKRN